MTGVSRKKIVIACVSLALAAAMLAVSVLAVFMLQDGTDGTISYGTFYMRTYYSFDPDADAEFFPLADFDGVIELADENSPTYIENLRVRIVFGGHGEAYLRVRVLLSWTADYDEEGTEYEQVFRRPFEAFNFDGDTWLDDRRNSSYFYYNLAGTAACDVITTQLGQPDIVLPLIDGMELPEGFVPYPGMVCTLQVVSQAVQRNRVQAHWGVQESDLPVRN